MAAEASPPAGWRAPRLGNYELTSPNTISLGKNKVYKAMDSRRRRSAALKILPPAAAGTAQLRYALRHKVQLAARVRHTNVLTVYELGEASGSCFLSMELVEGIDLHDHVRVRGPFAAGEAQRLIIQAARALHQASKLGLAWPAVSPVSFLLTQANNQTVLKFLPLDALQERVEGQQPPAPEEFRAPEESRPGWTRDLRSVLYSLGATLFYMLTGRAPNPSEKEWGPLARSRASGPLLKALERLLARESKDRYADPAELLQELEPGNAFRAGPAPAPKAIAGDTPRPATRRSKSRAKAPAVVLRSGAPPWLVACMVLIIAAMGIAIAALAKRLSESEQTASVASAADGRDKEPPKKEEGLPKGDQKPPPDPEQPPPVGPPLLYPGAAALDVKELHNEFGAPWASAPAIPSDAPVLRVSRLAAPGADAKAGPTFETLAAACAAAAEGKTTVIEIHDNGPMHEPPVAVVNRSLVIRAGPKYRPLLVWDVERPGATGGKRATFLSVEGGDLMLGNLELAVDWTDRETGPACLVRVANGELTAWNSVFSVAGRHKAGVTLVRFESPGKESKRCWLSGCVGRGDNVTALDVQAVGAEVLVEKCLLVGGDQPLLRCLGAAAGEGATLRVIRSTLIAGKVLCQIAAPKAATGAADPAMSWMSWDALLARRGKEPGGILLDLPAKSGPENVRWRAVNSLYAGWKTLLSGAKPIDVTEERSWRQRWQLPEGDRALAEPWESLTEGDPAEAAPIVFATDPTAFAYASTFGPGLVGFDFSDPRKIPWARTNWLGLAYRRFALPEVEVLKDSSPPPIPAIDLTRYHGGKLNLNKTDLGVHLKEVLKKQELGPVVVLHLGGSGECKTSPVRVKNASLVLYFEPAAKGEKPLVLVPDAKVESGQTGVFQVENGSLEIVGGDIRCPDDKEAKLPPYLLHVMHGNLRIHGARLQGPLTQPPESYWGLIRLEGSGKFDSELVRGCTLHQTVLLTSRIGLHFAGVGTRTRLQHSLIVAGGHALHFQPGRNLLVAQLNTQCLIENCTLAARQAVVYVEDTTGWAALADPILIQTRASVFLNPFTDPTGKVPYPAGIVLYQGQALPHGMVAWQGESDVFDRRLVSYVRAAGPDGRPPPLIKPQTYTVWERVWGPLGDRRPILDVPFKNTFSLSRPQLDQLQVPAHPSLRDLAPGANLERLALGK
jgi:serine/threonine protein kinase